MIERESHNSGSFAKMFRESSRATLTSSNMGQGLVVMKSTNEPLLSGKFDSKHMICMEA